MKEEIRTAVEALKKQDLDEMTVGVVLENAGIKIPQGEVEVKALIACLEELESEGVISDCSGSNGGWGRTVGADGSWSFSAGFKVAF
ncbi:hypothetical protein [Alcanivorax sp.]|uniref:hypothetical protein n=1 Tax=Alcanivorax sp. TaxID=1872427 RepID=UPI0025C5F7A0|nr:hypothetical protein [Alcanivorax sp.]